VEEPFSCSFELNPAYHSLIEEGGIIISGLGEDGEARIVELADRDFFLATLYLPQLSSTPDRPHPLVAGFVRAAGKTLA
jgi:CTP synthase (UTP-ammonia lyase)